jgi:hypothetical protein
MIMNAMKKATPVTRVLLYIDAVPGPSPTRNRRQQPL